MGRKKTRTERTSKKTMNSISKFNHTRQKDPLQIMINKLEAHEKGKRVRIDGKTGKEVFGPAGRRYSIGKK
tara:strand:- start:1008 stop:1220 length:213 start_codon:yes stop_codon:yes gene_type:complete